MAMVYESDDCYFQKAGAIPFKWEIRPGVPKPQFLQPEPKSKPMPKHVPKPRILKPESELEPEPEPKPKTTAKHVPKSRFLQRESEPEPEPKPKTMAKHVPKSRFLQRESEPEPELESKPKTKPMPKHVLKPPFLQPEPGPKPKLKLKEPPFLSPPELTPPPSGSIFLRPLESRCGSFRSAPRTRSERWRFDRSESKKVSPKVAEPHYSKNLETLARWSMSGRRSLSPPLFSDSSSISPSSSASSYWSHQSSPRPVSDAEWAAFGLF